MASTKDYFSQITAFLLLSLFLGLRKNLNHQKLKEILKQFTT